MNILRLGLALLALTSAAVVLACAGNEVPTEPRSQRFDVPAELRLQVRLQSGSVSVRAGEEGVAQVDAVLRDPSRVTYEARLEGDTLLVESRVEGTSLGDVVSFRVDRGADVTILVPAGTPVSIETLVGAVELRDLTGGAEARTGNGTMRLESLMGAYNVTTSRGSIEAQRVRGSLIAETGSGLVDVGDSGGAFQVKTAYGRLFFQGWLKEDSESRFESADGRVSVQVKGARSLALEAAGSSVMLTAPPSFEASQRSESRIQGSLGVPRTSLYVRAGNGSVDVTLAE